MSLLAPYCFDYDCVYWYLFTTAPRVVCLPDGKDHIVHFITNILQIRECPIRALLEQQNPQHLCMGMTHAYPPQRTIYYGTDLPWHLQ